MVILSSKNMLRGIALLTILTLLISWRVMAESQRSSLPDPAHDMPLAKAASQQAAVFAGGCFWGVEAVFRHVKGVVSATSGYAGGSAKTANYIQVSGGSTDHAESVQVVYDPQLISYGQLLKIFFAVAHNPTELNRQGPDHGTQYRSAIFTINDTQKKIANDYIKQLQSARLFSGPIVTQVQTLPVFYRAEDYHQNFVARNPKQPYVVIHDLPKLENLRKQFPERYR